MRGLTDAQKKKLRTLWGAGVSTANMAREMGSGWTKSMVCGYRNRLGFPARTSPISGRPTAVPRVVGVKRVAPKLARLGVVPAAPPQPPRFIANPGGEGCRFPHGEPGRPSFRYCDAPRLPARAYCLEHHQVCYPAAIQPRRGVSVS